MSVDCRVIRPSGRDPATAQTPGMARVAGVSLATCGASAVWMGEVTTAARFRSGAHHHGDLESAIYVLRGRMRMRWGERLEHRLDAEAGDFVFVPAQTIHQEMSISDEPLVLILARGGQENVVVNVDLPDEVLQDE
ncbi:MAG: cupin domain-containing protein [Dehalococcoidia bacterium]|nr:cupin domain-containing protein [Dehalococcoidia bacterium]